MLKILNSSPAFLITTRDDYGFGDKLMAYRMVCILNDNAVRSYYASPGIESIVQQKYIFSGQDIFAEHCFSYKSQNTSYSGLSMISLALKNFKMRMNLEKEFKISVRNIPVAYFDLPIRPTAVVINSKSISSPYKMWPFFQELKKQLSDNNISYIDLDEHNIRNVECLNYAKKARVYVGLDSGMSHYVSSLVRKALIIQSGYSSFHYWCDYPNYSPIHLLDIPCRNCLLTNGCNNQHQCLTKISPEMVLGLISKEL